MRIKQRAYNSSSIKINRYISSDNQFLFIWIFIYIIDYLEMII